MGRQVGQAGETDGQAGRASRSSGRQGGTSWSSPYLFSQAALSTGPSNPPRLLTSEVRPGPCQLRQLGNVERLLGVDATGDVPVLGDHSEDVGAAKLYVAVDEHEVGVGLEAGRRRQSALCVCNVCCPQGRRLRQHGGTQCTPGRLKGPPGRLALHSGREGRSAPAPSPVSISPGCP